MGGERRFDLHVHSQHSPDCRSPVKDVLSAAREAGLAGIAVTDHGTVEGGLAARRLNRDPGLVVIVGSEVATDAGDVVGLFLTEEVRSRTFEDVLDEVRAQGGVAVLPHPFRGHCEVERLARAVDALEGLNGECRVTQNWRARRLAGRLAKPLVAGSDAHTAGEVGGCATLLDAGSEDEARESILRGRCRLAGHLASLRFTLSWAASRLTGGGGQ